MMDKSQFKFRYLIIIFSIGIVSVQGQSSNTKVAVIKSFSFMTGGIIIGESSLWINKFSAERSHLGFLVDITKDSYREKWDDQSIGNYRLWSISASGRYYLKPYGRSLFAEVSVGWAVPNLTVNYSNGSEQIVRNFGVAAWGVGWRFGRKKSKLFGEIGFRSALPLKTIHLHTGPEPLPGSTEKSITYQSWYFESFKSTSQFYLGVGYSFWRK